MLKLRTGRLPQHLPQVLVLIFCNYFQHILNTWPWKGCQNSWPMIILHGMLLGLKPFPPTFNSGNLEILLRSISFIHQKFQVAKMQECWTLQVIFFGGGFSRIQKPCIYRWVLHFRYLKCLIILVVTGILSGVAWPFFFPPQPGVGPAILRRGGGSTVSRPFEKNGARQSGAHFPKQGVNHFSLYEQ